MSCWRMLRLSGQAGDEQIPQLLVKSQFGSDAYTVFLTDLCRIWSEELDLSEIANRASTEQSPIEVSKHDTSQLAILLDHVQRSLETRDDTTCGITKAPNTDAVILHTTVSLPEPLDTLHWKFHLRKRSPVILKNELILPLLVTSHIQQERIAGLLGTISEKDRAITRLTDQFESTNMDLAAAFPSIGGIKYGRKIVKREQAAKHVPGLRQFDQDSWQAKTSSLQDEAVSTLGLFQKALSSCTPKVPPSLKSDDGSDMWWAMMDSELKIVKPNLKARSAVGSEVLTARTSSPSDTDDDETEDEFDTHENFKSRQPRNDAQLKQDPPPPSSSAIDQTIHDFPTDEDDNEGQDDDLDAPVIKSQSQNGSQTHAGIVTVPGKILPEVEPPSQQEKNSLLSGKIKGKGFRIGGKVNRSQTPLAIPEESPKPVDNTDELPTRSRTDGKEKPIASKSLRNTFKIGEKVKPSLRSESQSLVEHDPSTAQQGKYPVPALPAATVKEEVQVEEREETAEEKAERKRQELKRKNEELAKKQAQSKKKRRF